MRKKIIVVIFVGIVVAALITFMWWWLFSRPTPIPIKTGTFDTAQNRPGTTKRTGTTNTNTSASTVGTNVSNVDKVIRGTYSFKTLQGNTIGSYAVNRDQNTGSFNITPIEGSTALSAGTYTLHIEGVTIGDYIVSPAGGMGSSTLYTYNLSPYYNDGLSVGNTGSTTVDNSGGGDWLSIPPIDITPVLSTGIGTGIPDTGVAPSGLGIGGGLRFSSQAPGTIFSNTNPHNFGLIPNIGQSGSDNGGGMGMGGAVIGAVAAGAVACALPALAQAIGGSFALVVTGQALVQAGGNIPLGVPAVEPGGNMQRSGAAVISGGQTISQNLGLGIELSNLIQSRVLDCFARTVAHAALEQIARSTIQWINSGFNGSPSFVNNYDQFFTNVADKAAGQFLQGSALSFMCSPFKLQVKIAIAKSYAYSRGQGTGGQCSLTSVVKNVNSFMNGDFSSGGWPGLLSFMGEPTNNPYGAFSAGSIGISLATANAVGSNALDLSLSGGFLSIKQPKNCKVVPNRPADSPGKIITTLSSEGDTLPNGQSAPTQFEVCDNTTVTPGTAIAQVLDHTIGINTASLETAKYFDEILSALVSQLIQNVTSKGLANLSSGNNGYVHTNTEVNASGAIQQSVLQNIPSLVSSAVALRDYSTKNITSIQASLSQASNLRNCWLNLASASTTPTQSFKASQNVFGVDGIINDLTTRITVYQAKVDKSNFSIHSLQNIGTQAQSTTNVAQLENIMTNLATQVQNQTFTQDTDVVNAQEDQTNLSAQLDSINQNIKSQLLLCSVGNTAVQAPAVDFSNSDSLIFNVSNTSNGSQ